jgi:hypothetical protein
MTSLFNTILSVFKLFGIFALFVTWGLSNVAHSQQFDAPYYEFKKKNGANWN